MLNRSASVNRAARPIPVDFESVHVTQGALQCVREHHPNCGWRGVLRLLAEARPIAGGELSGFLARPLNRCQDDYFLAHDGRGIYVVAPRRIESEREWAVVTYMRLTPWQQARAVEIWGVAS